MDLSDSNAPKSSSTHTVAFFVIGSASLLVEYEKVLKRDCFTTGCHHLGVLPSREVVGAVRSSSCLVSLLN